MKSRPKIAIGGSVVALIAAAIAVTTLVPAALGAQPVPSGSPLSGKIAYGFGDAFTINPDGSQLDQIGVPGSTVCTAWSLDTTKLLCNVFSDNGPQPATANPNGSDFTYLNQNLPVDLFCLYYSPQTGSRLLCHSEGIANPADSGLYTIRSSDGRGLVRVSTTLPGGFDDAYGYSPDGSRILYTQFDANGVGSLLSVKTDGSDPIRLSPPGLSLIDLNFYDEIGASWSPDGSQVTFAAHQLSSNAFTTALYVVNANGSGLHQIASTSVGAISARWSPDGKLIAFTGCPNNCGNFFAPWHGGNPQVGPGGNPQVWVVHPDGSGLRQITTATSGYTAVAPIWSPDSTKLLFNRQNGTGAISLWTVNSDGSGLSKLTDTEGLTGYAWGSAPPG